MICGQKLRVSPDPTMWQCQCSNRGEGCGGLACMNLYLRCSASAKSHRLLHLSRLPPLPAVQQKVGNEIRNTLLTVHLGSKLRNTLQ